MLLLTIHQATVTGWELFEANNENTASEHHELQEGCGVLTIRKDQANKDVNYIENRKVSPQTERHILLENRRFWKQRESAR